MKAEIRGREKKRGLSEDKKGAITSCERRGDDDGSIQAVGRAPPSWNPLAAPNKHFLLANLKSAGVKEQAGPQKSLAIKNQLTSRRHLFAA